MAQVYCDVSEGLRDSEATVMIQDFNGEKHFLPVDREMLHKPSKNSTQHLLSVRIVSTDKDAGAALVELPVEADSGANRIWMKLKDLVSKEREIVS